MSVHIVENDIAVLDSLKVFLEGHGHKVQVYVSAECFFKKTLPTGVDTVIVDLCLPNIHGTQLIRWIRALQDRPQVIAISGQTDKIISEQMRDLPEVVVIRKPLADLRLTRLLN